MMEIASLCLTVLSTLNISPNRSQFFQYDTITFSCAVAGNSSGWTLKRNTSLQTSELCDPGWGILHESSCTIVNVYPSDTGVYWCESECGASSNAVNITVADGVVILDSPAFPVTEGDEVTILCYYQEENDHNVTFNFSANFYKDDVFIGTQAEGRKTFSTVSLSDEGFYKCEHPTKGESPQSRLAVNTKVRAQSPPPTTTTTATTTTTPTPPPPTTTPPPPPPISLPRLVCTILLMILHIVMLIVCVTVHRNRAKARAEAKKRASDHFSLE